MAAVSDSTNDFGVRLCEALGLDPTKTKNIIITCNINEPVMVYVSQYLQDVEITPFLELLKKGKLEVYKLDDNAKNENIYT